MADLSSILAVMGLFALRIGAPVVVLITLGILIDRWQTRRNAEIQRQFGLQSTAELSPDEAAQVEETADTVDEVDQQHKVA